MDPKAVTRVIYYRAWLLSKQKSMEELRERLEASEARVRQLEEELDLLAFDNERLRAEIKQLKESNDHSPKQSSQPEKSIQEVQTKIIVVEGDNKYPNKIRRRFDNVCSGSNVIAVKYVSIAGREAILCGGADRSVRCFDSATGSPYCSFFMPGPVLSLAAAPCPADNSGSSSGRSGLLVLVAAAMDGSVVITRLSGGEAQQHYRPAALHQHGKYVVDARVSLDGTLVATASHDKSVNIYSIRPAGDTDESSPDLSEEDEAWMKSKSASSGGVCINGLSIVLRQRLRFEAVPESIAFVRPAGQAAEFLAVALRDSCRLVLVNATSLEASSVSLNEHDWDTHVSFNALHLAVAPDAAHVAVSTDKDMHLVLRLAWQQQQGQQEQVNEDKEEDACPRGAVVCTRLHTLSGHTCGEYGKPKASWDLTGQYLLSNSQNDCGVHVFDVNLERVVASAFGGKKDQRQQSQGAGEEMKKEDGGEEPAGHRAAIRDVCCHPARRTALTCGDGSVIEWHREEI